MFEHKGTKEDPKGLWELHNIYCKDHNIPTHKEVELNHVLDYRKCNDAKQLSSIHVILNGEQYKCYELQTRKGGKEMLAISNNSGGLEVSIDTDFDRVFYYKYYSLKAILKKIQRAGKYKYSESGGWYSMRQLYKYKNCFYCDLRP